MLSPSINRGAVGKGTIAAIIVLTLALTLPIAAMQAQSSVPVAAKIVLAAPVPIKTAPVTEVMVEKAPSATEIPIEEKAASAVIQQPPAAAPVQKVTSVAMVVAIDTSGSMSQGQMTIAKESAKAALKVLRDSDRFGTLSFNTGFMWIAPLQSAANRDAIGAQIETMSAGGGTNIYVGLNAAYDALKDAKEDAKRVVLLSDGITQTADFQALVANMLNAGISVSTVVVGVNANRALLADIAMWGKGRAYYMNSYARVPEVLVSEAEFPIGKTP
jgi:hypothetical protein